MLNCSLFVSLNKIVYFPVVFPIFLLIIIFFIYLLVACKKRSAELISSLYLLQIKELEAGGIKPQDSKIDTGSGAKRKVLTN